MSEETSPQPEPTAAGAIPEAPSTDGANGAVAPEEGSAASVEANGSGERQETKDWQQEAKRFQRMHDRLHETVAKPLKPILERWSPEQVSGFVAYLETAYRNPRMKEILEHFERTGEVPEGPRGRSAGGDGMDTDDDLEEFVSKRELQRMLQEQETRHQQVVSQLQGLQKQQGMGAIESFYQKFRSEYEFEDDEWNSFLESMDPVWNQMLRSPQGPQMIQNLDYKSFKRLALPEAEEILPSVFSRRFQGQKQRRVNGSTDGPMSATATTGREPEANPKVPETRAELMGALERVKERVRAEGR